MVDTPITEVRWRHLLPLFVASRLNAARAVTSCTVALYNIEVTPLEVTSLHPQVVYVLGSCLLSHICDHSSYLGSYTPKSYMCCVAICYRISAACLMGVQQWRPASVPASTITSRRALGSESAHPTPTCDRRRSNVQ